MPAAEWLMEAVGVLLQAPRDADALRALVLTHGVSARFVEFTHLVADLKAGIERGNLPIIDLPLSAWVQ